MKLLDTVIVFDQGNLLKSKGWESTYAALSSAVSAMEHPLGAGSFQIRAKEKKVSSKGKETTQWLRNGVKPIKDQFQNRMRGLPQWKTEHPLSLDKEIKQVTESVWMTYPKLVALPEKLHSSVGDLDFWGIVEGQRVAIEWETGNISSSHRSVNKLCLALLSEVLDICVLIVPSRNLYEHLTDRVGNWKELSPYLPFWRKIGESGVKKGLLAFAIVEHAELITGNKTFPFISVGIDGRSAQGKRSRKIRG